MGEIAEGLLSGFFCQVCGSYIDGEEPGFPRYCSPACKEAHGEEGEDE